jgi:hypothetical protein
MANIKHVGQLKSSGRRCIVVFREVPDQIDHCLVVDTDALADWMHDDMINAVESPGAQETGNFYEYAQRTMFTDGSNMLQSLHSKGLLMKQPTTNITMTPNGTVSIGLDELNKMISEQTSGKPSVAPPVDPADLTMAGKGTNPTPNTVAEPQAPVAGQKPIDDTSMAQGLLNQAISFENEAKALREQAFEMSPELKPKRGRPSKTNV